MIISVGFCPRFSIPGYDTWRFQQQLAQALFRAPQAYWRLAAVRFTGATQPQVLICSSSKLDVAGLYRAEAGLMLIGTHDQLWPQFSDPWFFHLCYHLFGHVAGLPETKAGYPLSRRAASALMAKHGTPEELGMRPVRVSPYETRMLPREPDFEPRLALPNIKKGRSTGTACLGVKPEQLLRWAQPAD